MSWATCYSGSNNIHFNNPPLMSDGRHLTNWDPGCTANNTLRSRVGIKSNYDYRQYLMKNADKVKELIMNWLIKIIQDTTPLNRKNLRIL